MITTENKRLEDVKKLYTERKEPVMGFDWEQRYDMKYILAYARKKGWNASRLSKAVENLDRAERQLKNFLIQKHKEK